ncbi:MAG: gluconate 2-dehydrogenase subunit 3 family protein [Pseudomonadota bacterium]
MDHRRRDLLKTLGLGAGLVLSPSCQRAFESGADLSAPPVSGTLAAEQLELISTLAELIIPSTDTPGAIEAGVPSFIHQIVVDWYTQAEQQIFLDGLAELEAGAERHWGTGFLALDAEQQSILLTEMEPPSEGAPGSTMRVPPGAAGDVPFYQKLKELTVLGYYTSELAARTELDYQPVPGHYDGDARWDTESRQWVR